MDFQFLILLLVFIQTSYTDMKKGLIRNYITFPLMLYGLIYHGIYSDKGIGFSFLGIIIALIMTASISLFLPNLGMGDVKLMMGIGSLMGYNYAVNTYFYALVLFALVYGLFQKSLMEDIGHTFLTIKGILITGKAVSSNRDNEGKALAPFIGVAGLLVYFFEVIQII